MDNIQMNEPIDSLVPINKYFELINDCIQYTENVKTPHTDAQLLQKSHHSVLESGLYTNAFKEWIKKDTGDQTWIKFNKFFTKICHDMKLTQNISAGKSGQHRKKLRIPHGGH